MGKRTKTNDFGLLIIAVVIGVVCYVGYRTSHRRHSLRDQYSRTAYGIQSLAGVKLVSSGTDIAMLHGDLNDSGQLIDRRENRAEIALWAKVHCDGKNIHLPSTQFRIRDENNFEFPNRQEWHGSDVFVLLPKGYGHWPRQLTMSLVRQGQVVWTCQLPRLPMPIQSHAPLATKPWPDLSIQPIPNFRTNDADPIAIKNIERFVIQGKPEAGNLLVVRTIGSSSCLHEPSDDELRLFRLHSFGSGRFALLAESLNYPMTTQFLNFEVTERALVHHRVRFKFEFPVKGDLHQMTTLGSATSVSKSLPGVRFSVDTTVINQGNRGILRLRLPGRKAPRGVVVLEFGVIQTRANSAPQLSKSQKWFCTLFDRAQKINFQPSEIDGVPIEFDAVLPGIAFQPETPPTSLPFVPGKVGDLVTVDMDYTAYDKVVRIARFSVKCK